MLVDNSKPHMIESKYIHHQHHLNTLEFGISQEQLLLFHKNFISMIVDLDNEI